MRLFFAIELPAELQVALGRLNPRDASRDYRWSDAVLLHISLAFLGEQPEARLAELNRIGTAAAEVSRAGVLRLGEAGSFGPRSAPRVLWIGLDGDLAALLALQSKLDMGLKRAGLDLEAREYRPHITLARRRESARGGAPSGWPPPSGPSGGTEFPMRHLTLFQSHLSPRGPTYVPLAEFTLGTGISRSAAS